MCCSGVACHTPVIQGIFVVNSYRVNNSQGFKLKLASLGEWPVLASGLEVQNLLIFDEITLKDSRNSSRSPYYGRQRFLSE